MSDRDSKILSKVQSYWDSTVKSEAWREWFITAVKCESYRSGSFSIASNNRVSVSDPFLAELKSHENESNTVPSFIAPDDQKFIGVNLIDPYVNLIVGEHLKNDTSVSIRAFEPARIYDLSGGGLPITGIASLEELEMYVEAHNAELYKSYEQCSVNYFQNRTLDDMCVYGIGGGFFDVVDGVKKYQRINPLYIVPDIRDETMSFEDSEYVGHLVPMTIQKALKIFPKLSKAMPSRILESSQDRYTSPARIMYSFGSSKEISDGYSVFVKMIEWKESETAYEGLAENGRYFCVFDEELAQKFIHKKSEIKETKADRIHRAYFVDGLLLHHSALPLSQPRDQFSLVLSCLSKKSSKQGFYIPKSIVENLIDIHDALVINLTKATHLSFSKKLIVKESVFENNLHSSPEEIKSILAAPISILVADDPNNDYRDISHQQTINNHLNFVHEFFQIADRATGINREQQGLPTNAHTGIAIRQRQNQSVTSTLYAFNEFSNFKKKIGRLFLQTIQMQALGHSDVFYPSSIKNMSTVAWFNIDGGDGMIKRDINFLPLDVYIDETKRYLSSKEAQFDLLLDILQSPAAPILLQSQKLLENLPIPLDKEIIQELVMLSRAQQPPNVDPQMAQPQLLQPNTRI